MNPATRPSVAISCTLLLSLLSSAAPLSAQDPKLPPIPEIQQIEDLELIQGQRFMGYVASKVDFTDEGKPVQIKSSWFDRKIMKGKLDGKTVYLVKKKGELAQPKELGFASVQEMALYDDEFQLIEARRMGRRGGKPELVRFRWQDGKLLRMTGRKKKGKEVGSGMRPFMKESLFLKGKGLESGKKVVPILDMQKARVRECEFKREARTWRIGTQAVIRFTSDEDGEVDYLVRPKDRAWVRVEAEGAGWFWFSTKDSKDECSLSLCSGLLMTEAVTNAALKAWKGRRLDWKNSLLGIKLRLPKKKWAFEKAVHDGDVFLAYGGKQQALFSIAVHPATPSLGLDAIVADQYKQIKRTYKAGDSTSRYKVKLGRRDAEEILVSHTDSNRNVILDRFRFVLHKGHVLEFEQIYYEADADLYREDMETIWSKIRFTR